jgi:hypothetical protein
VELISRLMFGFAAVVLMVLSIAMIAVGVWGPVAAMLGPGENRTDALLGAIGYVVIAIAVFDVAKFLIEEEVVGRTEKRTAGDVRRSLTRFISTIAIAVFLEALVVVFRVSSDRVAEMLYPTLLLVAGTGLIIGLALYQRLSVTVERQVDAKDKRESSF